MVGACSHRIIIEDQPSLTDINSVIFIFRVLLNESLGKVALSLSMPCLEGYNQMVGAHEYDNMSFLLI